MAYNRTHYFQNASEPEFLPGLAQAYVAGQKESEVIGPNLRYVADSTRHPRVALEYFSAEYGTGGVIAPYTDGMWVHPGQTMLQGQINRATAIAQVHVTFSRRGRYSGDEWKDMDETLDPVPLPMSSALAATAWDRIFDFTWVSQARIGHHYVAFPNADLLFNNPPDPDYSDHAWVPEFEMRVGGRVLLNYNEYGRAFDAELHEQIGFPGGNALARTAFHDKVRPTLSNKTVVEMSTGITGLRWEHYEEEYYGSGNYIWSEYRDHTHKPDRVRVHSVPVGHLTPAELVDIGGPDFDQWCIDNHISQSNYYYNIQVVVPFDQLEAVDATDIFPPASVTFQTPFDGYLERINSVGLAGGGTVASVEYRTSDMPSGQWVAGGTAHTLPVLPPEERSGEVMLTMRATLQGPAHHLFGWTVSYESHERTINYEPPTPDTSGSPPGNWHESSLPYRTVTHTRVTHRHPQMPVGLNGVRVRELYTGTERTAQRWGEQLVVTNGQPPYLVYFDPASTDPPLAVIPESQFLVRRQQDTRMPAWGGVEQFRHDRNLITPHYQVLIDGIDYSAYVTEFQPDRVKLVGPPSFNEQLGASPHRVMVSDGVNPVTAGIVTRIRSNPHANVRELDISTSSQLQYFDVDISTLDMRDALLPSNEEEYIYSMFQRANFAGLLYKTPGVQFRDTSFWGLSPVNGGPGLVEEDVKARYWNPQGGSTRGEIEAVAQANMLNVYDLPDGNVLLAPIVPLVDATLKQIVEQHALVYCVDSEGNYVNDPRLNISGVELALDDGFAEVEVEGFSNVVDAPKKPGPALFVQGTGDDARTQEYWDQTIGTLVPSIDFIAPFQSREGGVTGARPVPVEWMGNVEPQISKTVIDSWGLFGGVHTPWQEIKRAPASSLATVSDQFKPGNPLLFPGINLSDLYTRLGISAGTPVYYALQAHQSTTGMRGGTVRYTVQLATIDEALMQIRPLLGQFNDLFVPAWLSDLGERIQLLKERKPRKAKRVQNPFIAEIGYAQSVQLPVRPGISEYFTQVKNGPAAASHLATWLTVQEFLNTRRVELSYAGAQHWTPGQFIAIPRRPENVGDKPRYYDVLVVMDMSRADARVGAEAWVRVQCGYVGCYDTLTEEAHNDMPLGWGATWEV